jgi:prophage antirepressor-like protein
VQEAIMETFSSQEFGSVRIIEEDGKYLFCGIDVASALGYSKPRNAITAHCRYALKRGVPHPQAPDKLMEMVFIPEGDVYRLIAHSKLPSAERFESWVFDEVLPTIRKHGAYVTDNVLNNPDLLEKALNALKAEREKRAELEAKNAIQLGIIQEMEPKVSYYDIILRTKNAVPITLIAKDYGMSATRLNRILHSLDIQYRVGGTWMLYQKYAAEGYTVTHTYIVDQHTSRMHTCWTQKGRLFLYDLLCDNGIYPVMEGRE